MEKEIVDIQKLAKKNWIRIHTRNNAKDTWQSLDRDPQWNQCGSATMQASVNLQMTGQNVWNMRLFENFFKVLSLSLEARVRICITGKSRIRIQIELTCRIRIRINRTSRIWIRIKMTSRMRIRNTDSNHTGSGLCTMPVTLLTIGPWVAVAVSSTVPTCPDTSALWSPCIP